MAYNEIHNVTFSTHLIIKKAHHKACGNTLEAPIDKIT